MTRAERDALMHRLWKVERKGFPQIARQVGLGRNAVVAGIMRHIRSHQGSFFDGGGSCQGHGRRTRPISMSCLNRDTTGNRTD